MTTHKDYTSGADTKKVTGWDRSGNIDTRHNSGDDTKKMGDKDPQQKEGGGDSRKM